MTDTNADIGIADTAESMEQLGGAIGGLTEAIGELNETATFGNVTYIDFRGYEVDALRRERIIGPAPLPDDFEEYRDVYPDAWEGL